jgi:multicomponent K+:H+ antiporter subunit F
MIDLACLVAIVAASLAIGLTLYRLTAGPDVLDRVLALDTLVINAIALIVLTACGTARSCTSRPRSCSRWSAS